MGGRLIANREIKTASDKKQIVIAKGALLEFGGLAKGWPVVITKDGTRCVLSKADLKHLNAGKLNEMPVRVGDVLRLRESLQVGTNIAGSKMRTPDGSPWGKKFKLPDGSEPRHQYRGRRIPNGSIVKVAGWAKDGKMLIEYEVKTAKKNEHGEMVTEVSKMQAAVGRPLLANRAYAITSYGAQGQTVGFTLYSDSGSKGATSARQWYVDISRAVSEFGCSPPTGKVCASASSVPANASLRLKCSVGWKIGRRRSAGSRPSPLRPPLFRPAPKHPPPRARAGDGRRERSGTGSVGAHSRSRGFAGWN